MSSEDPRGAMNQEASTALVPELRFPEFRGAEEWKIVPLSDLVRSLDAGVSVTSGDRPATKYEIGILKTSSVTNGIFEPLENKVVFDEREKERVKEPVESGTIIISRMNTPALVGANAYVERSLQNVFLPDRLWAAKPKQGVSMRFVASILGSARSRADLSKIAKGSSGSMKNISKVDVLAFRIQTPSPAEQEKIAACLSSLDELIAAQAQKVEALKTHKKGLMQQRFPREGETVPDRRFAEFKAAGDWMVLPLAALADRIMVGIASAATHAYRETGVPMLRNQNIKEGKIDDSNLLLIDPGYEAAHKGKRLRAGDVITVRTGYPGVSAVVPERYENAQCFTSLITRPKNKVLDSDYLCALINSDIGKRFILGAEAGGAQKNVNAGALEMLPVCLPGLEEQRGISACLSSLDALITAQSRKLEALKTHKQALMQQLFPSPEQRTTP